MRLKKQLITVCLSALLLSALASHAHARPAFLLPFSFFGINFSFEIPTPDLQPQGRVLTDEQERLEREERAERLFRRAEAATAEAGIETIEATDLERLRDAYESILARHPDTEAARRVRDLDRLGERHPEAADYNLVALNSRLDEISPDPAPENPCLDDPGPFCLIDLADSIVNEMGETSEIAEAIRLIGHADRITGHAEAVLEAELAANPQASITTRGRPPSPLLRRIGRIETTLERLLDFQLYAPYAVSLQAEAASLAYNAGNHELGDDWLERARETADLAGTTASKIQGHYDIARALADSLSPAHFGQRLHAGGHPFVDDAFWPNIGARPNSSRINAEIDREIETILSLMPRHGRRQPPVDLADIAAVRASQAMGLLSLHAEADALAILQSMHIAEDGLGSAEALQSHPMVTQRYDAREDLYASMIERALIRHRAGNRAGARQLMQNAEELDDRIEGDSDFRLLPLTELYIEMDRLTDAADIARGFREAALEPMIHARLAEAELARSRVKEAREYWHSAWEKYVNFGPVAARAETLSRLIITAHRLGMGPEQTLAEHRMTSMQDHIFDDTSRHIWAQYMLRAMLLTDQREEAENIATLLPQDYGPYGLHSTIMAIAGERMEANDPQTAQQVIEVFSPPDRFGITHYARLMLGLDDNSIPLEIAPYHSTEMGSPSESLEDALAPRMTRNSLRMALFEADRISIAEMENHLMEHRDMLHRLHFLQDAEEIAQTADELGDIALAAFWSTQITDRAARNANLRQALAAIEAAPEHSMHEAGLLQDAILRLMGDDNLRMDDTEALRIIDRQTRELADSMQAVNRNTGRSPGLDSIAIWQVSRSLRQRLSPYSPRMKNPIDDIDLPEENYVGWLDDAIIDRYGAEAYAELWIGMAQRIARIETPESARENARLLIMDAARVTALMPSGADRLRIMAVMAWLARQHDLDIRELGWNTGAETLLTLPYYDPFRRMQAERMEARVWLALAYLDFGMPDRARNILLEARDSALPNHRSLTDADRLESIRVLTLLAIALHYVENADQ